ncbi:hypothetical protein M885DRAFT_579845 [Pelagophyceae sp. CCMP2097]|nr:hypothetical protein M885DRAFT_579845 [Pelagophyceae sp. CCMP2097]
MLHDRTRSAPREDLFRRAPGSVADVNNLRDEQYCCVWAVEVIEDGYRPEVVRALLARVARHVNPILRARGWRCKRLCESTSRYASGVCYSNRRGDADAASTIIQLNVRTSPHKHCQTFRSFGGLLGVMLHEITHTSIGLGDIHPPAFYDLQKEIKQEYRAFLRSGAVAAETDAYGCDKLMVSGSGKLVSALDLYGPSADEPVEDMPDADCGVRRGRRRNAGGRQQGGSTAPKNGSSVPKKRPLLRGQHMLDGRTGTGKLAKAAMATRTPRDLAARAALRRFGDAPHGGDAGAPPGGGGDGEQEYDDDRDDDQDSDGSDDGAVAAHRSTCACRSCEWGALV